MSQSTSFDGLPLIVHDRILRYLSSPQDVANTIRASPDSLYAFVTGRRSILLSAMRNFLSLENQHLMNLVVAAPHYYHNRRVTPEMLASWPQNPINDVSTLLNLQVDSSSFDGSIFTAHDLNRAVNFAYIRKRDMRPLTPDNFDDYIKLYAVLGKAIAGYNAFTLARSQGRVPRLSTPKATRSRYQFIDCDLRTPDEEETSRIWSGFLTYEFFCVVHGVRQMMDIASNRSYNDSDLISEVGAVFAGIPRYMREEVMCVQNYVQEQYDLAFNELVESFEGAVSGIGQRAIEESPPPTGGHKPIADLEWEDLQEPVQYLFKPPFCNPNSWASTMAELGIILLQQFLSWDTSTRLDFTRITHPVLSTWGRFPVDDLFKSDIHVIDMDLLKARNFGWYQGYSVDWSWGSQVSDVIQPRLRAVGWIFWREFNRLSFMNLVEGEVDKSYGWNGSIPIHLRLQGRPHLLEKLVETQEWEPIVQRYGSSFSESQLDNIKGLFKSIDNLNPSSIADVVSALRYQDDEAAPAEAQENGD